METVLSETAILVIATGNQIIHNAPVVSMSIFAAVEVAAENGIPVKPTITLLILGSSHNFLTPVGCTECMIAAAAGNYTFLECIKAGWLLQLLQMVGTMVGVWGWVCMAEAGWLSVE